jgi:hypothetical protein
MSLLVHFDVGLHKKNRDNQRGDRAMAGRYQGYHIIRDKNDGDYQGFEVFWQPRGWFWRRMATLDAEAVGPFTKSTDAYQSALASKPTVTPAG